MEGSKSKYRIAGHDFDLKEQISDVAGFVLWGKDLVGEAVKASPEASLAWSGVCLVLPLLTHPYLASESNKTGFSYVTTRMSFYEALEPLLLPDDNNVPEDTKTEFRKYILDLYRLILVFQFESVVRIYDVAIKRFAKDVRNQDKWDNMLAKIKATEELLKADSKLIKDGAILMRLQKLGTTAESSLNSMNQLLSVSEDIRRLNEKQLEVQTDQSKTVFNQLQESKQTKYQISTSCQIWTNQFAARYSGIYATKDHLSSYLTYQTQNTRVMTSRNIHNAYQTPESASWTRSPNGLMTTKASRCSGCPVPPGQASRRFHEPCWTCSIRRTRWRLATFSKEGIGFGTTQLDSSQPLQRNYSRICLGSRQD